jgi:alpha-N-arabinofuranosidase
VTVHAGTYRERVNPPRGGISDRERITYRAAPGARVEIKGSEVIQGWETVQPGVWKVTLANSFFGDFNPYTNAIRGDWFNGREREHHTGAVYLNGDWLTEAVTLEEVLMPVGTKPAWLIGGDRQAAGESDAFLKERGLNPQLWFAQVDPTHTTLWAQFEGVNPNEQKVEINVRQSVFYPDRPGRNFITVRGFALRQAATPWAPPTAEQIGLIGTHWSKGWIIEHNIISHSVCTGVTLGKHGDEFDNTSADTAEGYVKTIERAQAHPLSWTRENIGHHVVRHNTISHCEQAGIVGSLGAAFSIVEGNVIHDAHVRRLFTGAEMAGIKFHAAIDGVIRGNHIYRTHRGLWLDWMTQGTRVTGNLFHDNSSEDLFVEVNHGPFMVDNNLFLSPTSLLDMSQGGAFVHNLFAGRITNRPEPDRETPYHPPHSTLVAGLAVTTGGDHRFFNNILVGDGKSPSAETKGDLRELRWISSHGLWGYDGRTFPLRTGGNVYYHGAEPYALETRPLLLSDRNPGVRLDQKDGRRVLHLTLDRELQEAETDRVTTEMLGVARIPELPYANRDGSPLAIDTDYFGKRRSKAQPTPGPFEKVGVGARTFIVW